MGYSSRKKTSSWSLPDWGFLAAFLFWSAAGLTFTLLRITPTVIAGWGLPDGLNQFVHFCLNNGDPILILLAAANTHLLACRQWTPQEARSWAVLIMLLSYGVEMVGVLTGLPFGNYIYTHNFGPVLFHVPLAIPLAWFVVVTNVLLVIRSVAPHLSRLAEALIGGILCMLYDYTLEPFATRVKSYWVWEGGNVAMINYPAWLMISGVLIWFFAPSLMTRNRLDPRPWLILGIMILIFFAGRWAAGEFAGAGN